MQNIKSVVTHHYYNISSLDCSNIYLYFFTLSSVLSFRPTVLLVFLVWQSSDTKSPQLLKDSFAGSDSQLTIFFLLYFGHISPLPFLHQSFCNLFLHLTGCFSFVPFKILSLSLSFICFVWISMAHCTWSSFSFLDVCIHVFHQIWEVWPLILQIFPLLIHPSSSGTPTMHMFSISQCPR